MDIELYNNLAGAINYRFPDKYEFWQVVQNHLGIFLEYWDEVELGTEPDEATMLTWVQEFEALSDYERLSQSGKDWEDLRLEFLNRPALRQLLKASRQDISDAVDAMTVQELRNVIKILLLELRSRIRQSLGE